MNVQEAFLQSLPRLGQFLKSNHADQEAAIHKAHSLNQWLYRNSQGMLLRPLRMNFWMKQNAGSGWINILSLMVTQKK